jgi:hypothetical protein
MNQHEFRRLVSELSDRFHGLSVPDARDVLASVVTTVAHRTSDPDRFTMIVVDLIETGKIEKVFVKDTTQ